MLEVELIEDEGPFIPNYKIELLNHNNFEDKDIKQKIEERFQCGICDHSSKRLSDIPRHMKEVHLKYKPYRCGICGYRSCRTYTLRVHMRTVHKGITNQCFKHSLTPEAPHDMNQTQETHHVIANSGKNGNVHDYIKNVKKMEKTFFCSYCHLKTKWPGSLRNHIYAVHMKAKPHHCPMCNYKSFLRYSIMRHFMGVHLKDKPHSCPLCPYKATRSDTLKVHLKRLHQEKGLGTGNSL